MLRVFDAAVLLGAEAVCGFVRRKAKTLKTITHSVNPRFTFLQANLIETTLHLLGVRVSYSFAVLLWLKVGF